MAQAKLKTVPVAQSAAELVADIEHDGKRQDAETLLAIFGRATGADPVVWRGGIIGYGDWHYKYESGREGDVFRVGFATRKARHSIYLMGCGLDAQADRLNRLGKWKRGAGCLYINKLADVDEEVLEDMIATSWAASD
ncbi:MAG: DUF1801 domain-containing protein [Pseudomonadota bacterium]